MAGIWSIVSRARNRLFSNIICDVNELKSFGLSKVKDVAFYSTQSVEAPVRRKSRYLLLGLVGIGAGVVVGGVYSYYRLLELRPIPNNSQKSLPKIITDLPSVEIARRVSCPTDPLGLRILLFQYPTCPFCCKVRAFMDYYGISYDVVEVNPVLRQQIKWSEYKKVPTVLIRVDGGFQQLNDSSMIISALGSLLHDKFGNLRELVKFYPIMEYHDEDGYRKKEIMNKYFLMFQSNEGTASNDQMKSERKWRKWADEELVHTLSPNVYRTKEEAFQAFRWFSEVGEWERLFAGWEVSLIVNVGAYAMWMIGKRLKRRHRLKDDVRLSLYDNCNFWLKELKDRGTPFHGGESPNLADLAVYGVLSSIEGCDAFKDLLNNTKISSWYYDMKTLCKQHHGTSQLN